MDLCAAPGGKSTLLSDSLPEGSLLVANEIIRSRVATLRENIIKWGNPNTIITNNDPKDFSALAHFFNVVLVDAPCSGEGMFRKDPSAVAEWSPQHVQLCAKRQRRIITDVWNCLKPDGFLIYSTCTYNRTENEENIRWILNTFDAVLWRISLDKRWNITESDFGYRLYPHKTKGEGLFVSILRKTTRGNIAANSHHTKKIIPSKNIATKQIKEWLNGDFTFVEEQGKIKAFPSTYNYEISQLLKNLRALQVGINVAEVKEKHIIPTVELALTQALHSDSFQMASVDLPTALRYLKRENIALPDHASGFILITYKRHPLGFVKNIGTRTNNLYPLAWRIRMNI